MKGMIAMARGPAVYGTKWETITGTGYRILVTRDAEMEDMLKGDLDIRRSVYHVLVKDGEDVLELIHEFNQGEAIARGKALAAVYEKRQPARSPAEDGETARPEDYL